MEGLVNYSSEDEQDDYPYSKVAVRDRGSGGAAISGRTATEPSGHSLKRSYEHSKASSSEVDSSRRNRECGNDRYKSGNSYYNEDKYKIDRRSDKSRDQREKRDSRDSKSNRDLRDGVKNNDYSQKYDYKKLDDHKRYREQKREYKRDGNEHFRDDKRYNRNDERKTMNTSNNKDRFVSKLRYDDRNQFDDRFNDERRAANDDRRGSGSYVDDRKKEFNDRRNYDDRKTDRRIDDRRTQRSYNDDRTNAYRPRRSNSPPPTNSKSNSKYSERKEDNARRDRKRHSRSRSRSRSPSADNLNKSNITAIKSSHQRTEPVENLGETKRSEVESHILEKKPLPTARNFEGLLTLPLSENAPKQPNVATVPVTVAAALNTTTATVQLPSYYNPNVINPNKYVEQMQKRKLIWGAKKTEESASKWGHAQFSQDQDGKVASKFMRLMGIKSATGTSGETSTSPNESEKKSPLSSTTPPSNIDVKSREVMFSTMEQQYEVARQVTHTMRGVGLGFSSRPY